MSKASALYHFLGTVRLKKSSIRSHQSLILFCIEIRDDPSDLRFCPIPGKACPTAKWSSMLSLRTKANSAPALHIRHPLGKDSRSSALAASLTCESRNIEGLSHVNFIVVCLDRESPVT